MGLQRAGNLRKGEYRDELPQKGLALLGEGRTFGWCVAKTDTFAIL